MKIAIFSVAVLALIQTVLGLTISALRWKYRISAGMPDDPAHPLFRVRTAFSNCAEWHPLLMALLLVLPMAGGPPWSIWLGPLAVAARCLQVTGLATFPVVKPNFFRFTGTALTFLVSLLMIVLLIVPFFQK